MARLIVVDASSIIGAALRPGNAPWRALMRVRERDRVAMSDPVAAEIRDVLVWPKFRGVLTAERRIEIERLIIAEADWFDPVERVHDCRDPDDDIYLDLALAARSALISSDQDLLALHPWRGVAILRPADYLALA